MEIFFTRERADQSAPTVEEVITNSEVQARIQRITNLQTEIENRCLHVIETFTGIKVNPLHESLLALAPLPELTEVKPNIYQWLDQEGHGLTIPKEEQKLLRLFIQLDALLSHIENEASRAEEEASKKSRRERAEDKLLAVEEYRASKAFTEKMLPFADFSERIRIAISTGSLAELKIVLNALLNHLQKTFGGIMMYHDLSLDLSSLLSEPIAWHWTEKKARTSKRFPITIARNGRRSARIQKPLEQTLLPLARISVMGLSAVAVLSIVLFIKDRISSHIMNSSSSLSSVSRAPIKTFTPKSYQLVIGSEEKKRTIQMQTIYPRIELPVLFGENLRADEGWNGGDESLNQIKSKEVWVRECLVFQAPEGKSFIVLPKKFDDAEIKRLEAEHPDATLISPEEVRVLYILCQVPRPEKPTETGTVYVIQINIGKRRFLIFSITTTKFVLVEVNSEWLVSHRRLYEFAYEDPSKTPHDERDEKFEKGLFHCVKTVLEDQELRD